MSELTAEQRVALYAINELRRERDKLLLESDWVVTKELENTGSVSNYDKWKTYRQALRDLPTQYSDDKKTKNNYLDWSKINLPTKPS
jgi:hypothetical protein